jgi:hypothetical protein
MSNDNEKKMWKCYACEHIFLPQFHDYNCPKCRSTNTVPNYSVTPKPYEPPEITGVPKLERNTCPKCGAELEEKYLHIWVRKSTVHHSILDEATCWLSISDIEPHTYRDHDWISYPSDSVRILQRSTGYFFHDSIYEYNKEPWLRKVLHCETCKLLIFEYSVL